MREHIVFSNIITHADHHVIMKYYQHCFRRGHNCEIQLIATAEDIGRDLDKQHQIDILILDFAKAFDSVPHERLLHKLNHYGVRGQA